MIQRTFRIAELNVKNKNQRLYDEESFSNLPASCPIVFGTDGSSCAATIEEYMSLFSQVGTASNFRILDGFLAADIDIPDGSLFAKATPEEFDAQFAIVPSGLGDMRYIDEPCDKKASDVFTSKIVADELDTVVTADEVDACCGAYVEPSKETRMDVKADEVSEETARRADEKADEESNIELYNGYHEKAETIGDAETKLTSFDILHDLVDTTPIKTRPRKRAIREYTLLALTIIDKKNASFERISKESTLV